MKSCVYFNTYLFGKYKINTIFAYVNLKTDIMNTTENTLQVFTKEVNPLNDNCICIFEQRVVKKNLLFQVDKANFESDNEFENAVDFILNSLNKNL